METQCAELSVPRFHRVKVAAERLGVSVRTLYRIVAEGKLRLVHVRGCSCVPEAELYDYMRRVTGGKAV